MTPKRLFLLLISSTVILFLGLSLLQGVSQPQVQDRLQLSQTALFLQASTWEGRGDADQRKALRKALLGDQPYAAAIEQYTSVQKSLSDQLTRLKLPSGSASRRGTAATPPQLETLLQELEIEQGLLEVQANQLSQGLDRWQAVLTTGDPNAVTTRTATILQGLWSEPPQISPDAESWLDTHLNGWFRSTALNRIYRLTQRDGDRSRLAAQDQTMAERALTKLAILVFLPILSSVIGGILLLRFLIQFWLRRTELPGAELKRDGLQSGKSAIGSEAANPSFSTPDPPTRLITTTNSIPAAERAVSPTGDSGFLTWTVPWDWEILAQGLLGGFFFVGQILVSNILLAGIFASLRSFLGTLDIRSQALSILLSYGVMAFSVLTVLALLLAPYRPLSAPWFRFQGPWVGWGFTGYFIATPLVLLVSLFNQLLWKGQGGSNPLLMLALENRDIVALILFFVTATLAAPIFEELLFRGFVLPSLTRYVSQWGAIALSGFVFALAHLSPAEVLPLTVLGMVLGFVYSRSGNLLAPMLLHGLWNGSTLLNLFLLGSA